MGMNMFSSSSDSRYTSGTSYPTDPNPSLFEIESIREFKVLTLVTAKYKNCTNFEGTKIIVMRGLTKEQILSLTKLDPHFLDDNYVVARFRPDALGRQLAWELCLATKTLKEKE